MEKGNKNENLVDIKYQKYFFFLGDINVHVRFVVE